MRTSHELTVDDAGLATICSPRDDIVGEELVSEGPVDDWRDGFVFKQTDGPFIRYRRRVMVGEQDGDRTRVRESFELELPPGSWRFMTGLFYASGLRRTAISRRTPWWAPTQRVDARALAMLGRMATLAFVVGYLSNLIAQTMTFAAEEFSAGKTAQAVALSGVRVGGLLAVGLSFLADRQGRARILLLSVLIAALATGLGAITPSLVGLGASQAVSRGATTAASAVMVVVLAEEMPKGARAWAIGEVTIAGGVGAGLALVLLPLAETGEQGWRILYAVPLLVVPSLVHYIRRVPETRRFSRPHGNVPVSSRAARLWLVVLVAILINVFMAPATQLRAEFLRDERAFDAATISIFTMVTGGLAGLGVIGGGRLAEAWGRRTVSAGASAVMGVAIAASFVFAGPAMWVAATLGMVAMAALAPATGPYGAELFPTSLRGGANGTVGALAMAGSVVGLIAVGVLSEQMGSSGPAMALVGLAPVIAAVLILTRLPETARQELEDLNPEDKMPPPDNNTAQDGEAPGDGEAPVEAQVLSATVPSGPDHPSGVGAGASPDDSSGAGSRT